MGNSTEIEEQRAYDYVMKREEKLKKYERDLRRIAFMGADCPAGMEPESFYHGQLYNCIGIAAKALSDE